MRIKILRIIRTKQAVAVGGRGYAKFDHAIEGIEIEIALEKDEAILVPIKRPGRDILGDAIYEQLGVDSYRRRESRGRIDGLTIGFRLLGRRPFGTSDPDEIAQISLDRLKMVLSRFNRKIR